MSDVSIRSAVADDLPRILDVLRAALGETPLLRRTPELWTWKHLDNPFGPSLVLVAELDERLVGVRAMMRWDLVTATGDTVRCLRPVDTATHPDFARMGIFRELTVRAVEEARAQGVHLVFNTPNDKSAPGYLRMGWREVGALDALVRPRFGAVATPTTDVPSITVLAPGLDPPDELVGDTRPARGLRTPRTKEYLRWRFASHPTASYGVLSRDDAQVVARASWRARRAELVVSDLLGDASARPIRALAHHSRARYLAGWFSPGSKERRAAILGGMLPIPTRTLQLVALPLSDLGIDVFGLASWDLATSDLELL